MRKIAFFLNEEGFVWRGPGPGSIRTVVWLCGAENAVMLAMTQPDVFAQLVELVDAFDRTRTELMLDVGGVDLVVQRGWYSTTDFWSPDLFERYVLPNLKRNVRRVHAAGARSQEAPTQIRTWMFPRHFSTLPQSDRTWLRMPCDMLAIFTDS